MIAGRWLHWAFRLRVSLLSAALGLLVVGSAKGHGIPILVDVSPEGKLVVTSGEDIGGIRVIFDNAQKFNATTGFTSAPGWDIVPAVQNSTIKLTVLSNLIFWNTADGIGGTTPASLTGRR